MLLPLGFLGSFLLNNFLKETYSSRKLELEKSIENLLAKNVDLGDYVGIRFLGISLGNSKINDKKNIDSEIKAKNVYVGIMPFKSFFKQKWIVKIVPKEAAINIDRDFFNRNESYKNARSTKKSQSKYELNFNLNKYSILKFKKVGLKTKIKGNVIYKSSNRQIIANLKSNFDEKGFLKFKFNTKLNQDFLSLDLFSRGLDLENSEYIFGNRKFSFKKGSFKSNFKFNKSSTQTFCKGRFSFSNLKIKPEAFSENINSDSTSFFCKDNNLIGNSENLNYGTLTSNVNLNVPLNKSSYKVDLKGSVGYIDSLNPDIKFSGNIPYWFDRRGINFGDLDSSFKINRTQLSNLNIFRKNDIRGFITAKGELKGNITDPDISINFNVDYPHYKGIRIREIWEGDIKKENNKFLLNMKNRYSPIPSFLSVKFDSKLKLDNANFIRVFNSNKGSIEIIKENDIYNWRADNFPLDELELSLSKNQFDRISGIINGAGSISSDQSYLDGRFAWSLGKYRNIKLANSLFDFNFKNNSFYVNSSLYPIDGGEIEVEYDSNKQNPINSEFTNISTNWTILTAVDIFNFENKIGFPISKSNILDDLEIDKNNNSFKERIDFINNFLENNSALDSKFNLQKYLNKFRSRYDAKLTIKGDKPSNYKLSAKLNGYLDISADEYKNEKEEFSIDLEGGLLRGEGSLKIRKLPLSAANIFLNQSRDFRGGFDMNLFYNLDEKSFYSEITSNNLLLKNNQILFDKGLIEFNDSIFNIDFSLLINDSKIPINIEGSIPINKSDNLDLRLIGNSEFIELIDFIAGEYFTFKEGDLNLRMIIKGTINKPILNGFVVIKDSEIDFYNNIIKNINSLIIFDFDSLEIKKLEANAEDSGNIFIVGSLPFYNKNNSGNAEINLITNKFNVKTNNFNFLIDSDIDLSGSFESPILGGNLSLNNGFINFNNTNKKNKIESNIKSKEDKKNWPELYWNNKKNIEIISNETILDSVLLGETLPSYLDNLSFDNLKLKLGPDFKLQYSEIVSAYLDTKLDLNINGLVAKDLNARGLIYLKKGRANLYTTPFKLDKNKDNYILFASRSGVVPYINFSLVSKVPDSIIPISENNQDSNIAGDINADETSSGFGAFGIGNTRLIKIEASYEGFLDQLSFEDENKRIQLRSIPSYSRSQIIGLIGGNSANLINRAFISQINNADAFSERFQFSLYPALIENNDSLNNIFSNENYEIENNEAFSSQAWVAEVGLDITDSINFAFQTVPGRDDISPLGILTFQATSNLELLGSYDSDGDWKSQVQLFFRY
ncbi:MAG: translocation/assembly module TamB domain-containing protein [Prochlorococcus marinus CUG1431]|uniref:Translocation/assembly module TamB domain-containing protein n=1 Tax=Prochlorococcus marinus CUG1433 TaxID=2774506 RepID=A0A9D9G2R1_PROMR|nr:translocation/assembly module TamB domain-containing protein [Prochlorococcus marinus CUG1433]MBO6980611.1 translocation/assembly module TamB domain-containing protein [Prochlorococcus marinus CUG1431]